jgi:hypothetical protein
MAAKTSSCAEEITAQVREALDGKPDALIVFGSPSVDLKELLRALHENCQPRHLIGCSSAGEFAEDQLAEGAVSALAIRSDEIEFQRCRAAGIHDNANGAAEEFASCLGDKAFAFKHRYILVLTDALAGHTEEFLAKLNELTAGSYQLFGGGAGDDAKFSKTFVFDGTNLFEDAAVGLAMYSDKPFGLGVRHGWIPATEAMRATEAEGFELVSLNAEPVLDVLKRHATQNGQNLDPQNPMPFFLHNVLGVASPGGFKIRVPLGFTERGGLIVATEIPAGSSVHIMKTEGSSAEEAAGEATLTALAQIQTPPAGVIFFDCVATRLRLGTQFGSELAAVRERVAPAAFVGCNSYGQVARVDGQFSGFHNCTAVVCVIPS